MSFTSGCLHFPIPVKTDIHEQIKLQFRQPNWTDRVRIYQPVNQITNIRNGQMYRKENRLMYLHSAFAQSTNWRNLYADSNFPCMVGFKRKYQNGNCEYINQLGQPWRRNWAIKFKMLFIATLPCSGTM